MPKPFSLMLDNVITDRQTLAYGARRSERPNSRVKKCACSFEKFLILFRSAIVYFLPPALAVRKAGCFSAETPTHLTQEFLALSCAIPRFTQVGNPSRTVET
jgi:hypothetical protein